MISRDRVRVLVGIVLTLAIVVPLGWMWWNSRLPSLYSVMDMGYVDYGAGARPDGHDMADMDHGTPVKDLIADPDRPADVETTLDGDLAQRVGLVPGRDLQDAGGAGLGLTIARWIASICGASSASPSPSSRPAQKSSAPASSTRNAMRWIIPAPSRPGRARGR